MSTPSIQLLPTESAKQYRMKTWHFSILIALIYSSSLAIVASALSSQFGFPLDDSYIHQTIARNLAHYGVLGFIPGVPSAGATSVLWAFIQAANHKFVHIDPIIFNLLLSWILLIVIGSTLFSIAQQDGMSVPHSLIFAAAPALCGNFIWLALIGMEHLLFVALVLGCITFWSETAKPHRALLAGSCAGLLALTRPEAIIFGPLLALTKWKEKRAVLIMLSAWIPLILILLLANFYTSHSLMPGTLKGRIWLLFGQSGGPHSLQSLLSFVLLWLRRMLTLFSPWHPAMHLVLLRTFLPVVLAIVGAIQLLIRSGERIRTLFLFAASHTLFFTLQFPSPGHGGRYQPLSLLLLFPTMFFGVQYLVARATRKHQIATAVATAALIVAGGASLRTWHIITIDGIAHINNTHGRAAQWLKENASAESRVAAFDIGRISYDLNHSVIDLGGLADPNNTSYLLHHETPAYVLEQKAQYLILPSGRFSGDLGFAHSTSTVEVAEFCSPREVWQIGWLSTGAAEQCQIIYKLIHD